MYVFLLFLGNSQINVDATSHLISQMDVDATSYFVSQMAIDATSHLVSQIDVDATNYLVSQMGFHKKESLPAVYLAHWIEEHCKRLITVLHRYIVHILTTGFHSVTERINDKNQGLELTTPVLEKAPTPWDKTQPLLPVSQVWILAATLPPLYTKPSHLSPTSSTNGFSMQNYLAKIVWRTALN
ncbi:hypothetical protein J6590_084162 [Homalodisca vitripennis]|nr:hypothetical protein J6590_084162 [Homalodisca vitripennis]